MAYKQLNKSKLEIKGYSRVEGYGVFFACFGVGFLVVWLGFFLILGRSQGTQNLNMLCITASFFSVLKSWGDCIAYKEKIISEAFSQKPKSIFLQS